MLTYMPNQYSCDRVVWYGDQSTQLVYEQEKVDEFGNPAWVQKEVKTLGNGIPDSMSQFHAEMSAFYDHCLTMNRDCLCDTL